MGRRRSIQHGFGLTFDSDMPLPGLPAGPAGAAAGAAVRVHLQQMPGWLSPDVMADAPLAWPVPGDAPGPLRIRRPSQGYLLLSYDDGTHVLVDPGATRVWATWPAPATVEDTATYLLGPVASLLLRLRGLVPLHASVVKLGGGAAVFAGPSGAGKSTIAAAFHRLGHEVLSDDVAAIIPGDGPPMLQPAFPRLRLWAESVEGMFGRADALPLISPNWDKRFLETGVAAAGDHAPVAVRAVYLLQPRAEVAEPTRPLKPREGLVALLANTSASWVLDAAMRERDLRTLARLCSELPLHSLTVPDDFMRLSATCAKLASDAAR